MATDTQKKLLRDLLTSHSTPDEVKLLEELDGFSALNDKINEVKSNMDDGNMSVSELKTQMSDVIKLLAKYKKNVDTQTQVISDSMKSYTEALQKTLLELKGAFASQDFNQNAGPLYKTMIDELSGLHTAFKGWKYPQYAAVSVRNKNFENVNPSVDLFNIGTADDIVLAYSGSNITSVTYKLNGSTIAVLSLSYSGSNLTEVQRTT